MNERRREKILDTIDDLEPNSMKRKEVKGQPILLTRTSQGISALDNKCPHQGYGLASGDMKENVVTCEWHNWKFDAATGECLRGEESVARHQVEVLANGEVYVTLKKADPVAESENCTQSLLRGIAANYRGQISRDIARLLKIGMTPAEIVSKVLQYAAGRTEDGVNHETAYLAECLLLAIRYQSQNRSDMLLLSLTSGIAGVAETVKGLPEVEISPLKHQGTLLEAIEIQNEQAAMGIVRERLSAGESVLSLQKDFIDAAGRHHLSYGHGIIFVQEVFQLIAHTNLDLLLPHLARSLCWANREDLLPYMRKFEQKVSELDVASLVDLAEGQKPLGQERVNTFAEELLDSNDPGIELCIKLFEAGHGIEGILAVVSHAASKRMLRHTIDVELSDVEPSGWLDLTHVLTMTNAVRWASEQQQSPNVVRMVFYLLWLLFDAGRSERRSTELYSLQYSFDLHGQLDEKLAKVMRESSIGFSKQIDSKGSYDRVVAALRRSLSKKSFNETLEVLSDIHVSQSFELLTDAVLLQPAGDYIRRVHHLKTVLAAAKEYEAVGSKWLLLACIYYVSSPCKESSLQPTSLEAYNFLETGKPPKR